ncbi:hypothetical protein CR513_54498, partial [Mucuna pruriens]
MLDTRATNHIYSNKRIFQEFEENAKKAMVYMGNSTATRMHGKEIILLKLTSGKTLALNNVLYVLEIHRNLVLRDLLNKVGPLIEWRFCRQANFQNTTSRGGKKYYIIFIDDYSRIKEYLLRTNDEVESILYTDGEYITNSFKEFCENNGIIHEFVAPYTLQQNEIVERKNRTLKDMMNGKAILTTCYILDKTINSELDSITSNHTWKLVDLPKGSKTIDSKWIFKRKYKLDGSIEKLKALLGKKKVTKIAIVCALISLATIHNLVIHQSNQKDSLYQDKNTRKFLHGLKQTPKQWYGNFNNTLVNCGFAINTYDSCVHVKMINTNCAIICLYVDDMLIFETSLKVMFEIKKFVSFKFEMKELGEANVIWNIKI